MARRISRGRSGVGFGIYWTGLVGVFVVLGLIDYAFSYVHSG